MTDWREDEGDVMSAGGLRKIQLVVLASWIVTAALELFLNWNYRPSPLVTPAAVLNFQVHYGLLVSILLMVMSLGLSALAIFSRDNPSKIVLAVAAAALSLISVVPPLHVHKEEAFIEKSMEAASERYRASLSGLDAMSSRNPGWDSTSAQRVLMLDMRRGLQLDIPTYLLSLDAFRKHEASDIACREGDSQACTRSRADASTFLTQRPLMTRSSALLSMFSTHHLYESP